MKKLITLILGLIIIGPAYAQKKVDNFYKAINAVPIGGKIYQMEVNYDNNLQIDSSWVKAKKPKNLKFIKEDKRRAKPIDEANIIDYKADTLYILSTYYPQIALEITTIKTGKGIYDLVRDKDNMYKIYPLENRYVDIKDDSATYWREEMEKKSDLLLFGAIFNWNIPRLMRIIKASGSGTSANASIKATRIIIKDNKVLKKDIIKFDDAGVWALNKEDLLY